MAQESFATTEKRLADTYFLIKKRDWYWWLGGVTAFLLAYFAINYRTTLEVLSDDAATKARASVENSRIAAEADVATLKQKLGEADESLAKIRQLANVSDQPTKVSIPIQGAAGKFASAMSYWGDKGNRSAGPFACNFKPAPRPGFEVVAKLSPLIRGSRRSECSIPADHCDRAGEYCTYAPVERACYVNIDWLTWYRRYLHKHNLEEHFNEIRVCEIL